MYITSNVIQTYIPRNGGKSLAPSFKLFLVQDLHFVAFRSASLLMIAPCSSCNYGSWSQEKQHAEMVGFSAMVKPGGVLPWENWSLIVFRSWNFQKILAIYGNSKSLFWVIPRLQAWWPIACLKSQSRTAGMQLLVAPPRHLRTHPNQGSKRSSRSEQTWTCRATCFVPRPPCLPSPHLKLGAWNLPATAQHYPYVEDTWKMGCSVDETSDFTSNNAPIQRLIWTKTNWKVHREEWSWIVLDTPC